MKKLKKSLSLLLALVMVVSCMSVGVFAQGETCTVTFNLTDSVGRLQLVDVDANYEAGNPYTNVYGTWNNGQYEAANTRVAFTQTVTSGGLATKPTYNPYYKYNVIQPNNDNPKQFTADDSHAYTFDGWATEDGKLYDFTNPVTANLTLHPRFSATGATITINDSYTLYNFAREVELGRKFNSDYAQGAGTPQTVQLSDNVTLTGDWEPIVQPFYGTFDGANHSISGLKINSTKADVGFFSVLNSHNVVKNLTFASPTVVTTGGHAGTLAGLVNAATITNVTVTNPNVSGKSNVGGLIGQANSGVEITNCSVSGTGTIQATEGVAGNNPTGRPVGGLIGNTIGGVTVSNCSVSGVTISGARKLGGLIGQVQTNADNAVFSCTGASVSNVTISSIATETFAKELTMGGLVGEFAAIQGTNTFSGTVSNINMTGPDSIANPVYIMGLVSGGTSAAVDDAENAMEEADMTFDVTVSGTNTRTRETASNYAGIMGTAVQTTTYVGYVKSLGANVGNTIYLNVKMVFPNAQDGMRLKYQIGNLAPTYFSLPTPDANGVYLFQIPVIAKYFGVQGTISLVDSTDETVYHISKGESGTHVTSVQYSVYDYLDLLEASSIRNTWLDLSTAIRNLGNMTAKHWPDSHNGDMANRGWIAYPAAN